jgi:histidyl-tRNA synthetase
VGVVDMMVWWKKWGNPTPAIGFAIGIERLILLIKDQPNKLQKNKPHLYFAALGERAQMTSMKLSRDIHSALPDIIITNDMSEGNLKNQMKKANKSNADFALILGEEELSNNQLSIKPLKGQGDQQLIKLEGIIQHLQEIL